MSLIQIDKKAATEAEAQAILKASYALFDPFGIPVLHIKPEDIQSHWTGFVPSFVQGTLTASLSARNAKRQVRTAVHGFTRYRQATMLPSQDFKHAFPPSEYRSSSLYSG